ncbi:MAG: M48 family metalloprotease [Terriglobales bacterium]
MDLRRTLVLTLVPLILAPVFLAGQCPPMPPAGPPRGANIFSEEQEMYLGDAVAEQLQRDFRVVEDPQLTAYLNRIGERLLRHMPATNLRFRFLLSEIPAWNAFTMPGGRIYFTRKLVGFARNEDEIAGVMAHELGHALMRDPAVEMTRRLQKVLGVTQLTDRKDVVEKYHLLFENWRRKPEAFERSERGEHSEQVTADQIALQAMARAGYSPQAYVELWDRFTETKGKTGSWLSDLFGTTKPESKRLREMLKTMTALPAGCADPRSTTSSEDFRKWQEAVVAFAGFGRQESLHGVLDRKVLDPPLQTDVQHLRFSPDGRYVLAQTDSQIYVLSRQPFNHLFDIEAVEAHPAQFTPDSQSVVFYDPTLRVEKWDIAKRQRTLVEEMVVRKGCIESALSPDGRYLACYGREYDLTLFDVAGGATVFQKKSFYVPSLSSLIFLYILEMLDLEDLDLTWVHMSFSPDGRYFVAATRDGSPLALDMSTRSEISLPGSIKNLLTVSFAFVSSDRLIGVAGEKGEKSAMVQFPSGQLIGKLNLAVRNELFGATKGDYLLLRPIDRFPVGVMDLKTQKLFMANRKSALDLYDNQYVSERIDGELAIYRLAGSGSEVVGTAAMPRGRLGRLRAAALSPDLNWLAISERTRGGVWDLEEEERVAHMRGFRGAYFSDDGSMYADFPELDNTDRAIARLDLERRQIMDSRPLDEDLRARQFGPYLLVTLPEKKGEGYSKNVTLDVRDTSTGASLWTRRLPKENPDKYVQADQGTLVLAWEVTDGAAKDAIGKDSALKARLAAMKEKEGDYYLEVLDVRTGALRGRLLVETNKGSFRIDDMFAAGDWVVITDAAHRVLVFSLKDGSLIGRTFGERPAVSPARGLLCVESERGELALFKLGSMEKRDQYVFPSPVSLARFSEDGKKLFVLTANQTAYWLDGEKW